MSKDSKKSLDFKYNIGINQKAVIENKLSLDYIDLIIFDCIGSAITDHEKKSFLISFKENGKEFYLIN